MDSKAILNTYVGKETRSETLVDVSSHQGTALMYMPQAILTTALALLLQRVPEVSFPNAYLDNRLAVNSTFAMYSLVMGQTQKGPRRESLSEGFSLGGAARPFSQNLGKVPKRLEA